MQNTLLLSLLEEQRVLKQKLETLDALIKIYQQEVPAVKGPNGMVIPIQQPVTASSNPGERQPPLTDNSTVVTDHDTDYPYDQRWPEKIIYILKRQSKPISLTALVEALSVFEPGYTKSVLRHRVLNNDRRMIDKGIIAATDKGRGRKLYIPAQTALPNNGKVGLPGPVDKTGLLRDYPFEGKWPDKLYFMLRQEAAPISFMALFQKFTSYEPGLSEKTLKEHLWCAEKRLLFKKLVAHIGAGLTRKLYCKLQPA